MQSWYLFKFFENGDKLMRFWLLKNRIPADSRSQKKVHPFGSRKYFLNSVEVSLIVLNIFVYASNIENFLLQSSMSNNQENRESQGDEISQEEKTRDHEL